MSDLLAAFLVPFLAVLGLGAALIILAAIAVGLTKLVEKQ